jgi:hypothetical protein
MTWTVGTNGRLGNQIIRNLATSLLAKKYDLQVNYFNRDLIQSLGIELFSGNNTYSTLQTLTDHNYFSIYHCNNLNYNLNPNNDYFQTKEITNFLHNYLHSDPVKSNIIEHNKYKERYNKNNDLFVHIRLTDAEKWNPGITYYTNIIKTVSFDNLYIATDDKAHVFIKTLLELYPSATVIDYDEVNTIQFGSTCKHVLLSHGSFSAVIGYLSFFSTILYPEYNHPGYIDLSNNIWYGDMFSIDNWIRCNVK